MSARRQLLRTRWRNECPPVFDRANKERSVLAGKAPRSYSRRMPYHAWAVLRKHRHGDFQARMHAARIELGLPPTSSAMHWLNGRRL